MTKAQEVLTDPQLNLLAALAARSAAGDHAASQALITASEIDGLALTGFLVMCLAITGCQHNGAENRALRMGEAECLAPLG